MPTAEPAPKALHDQQAQEGASQVMEGDAGAVQAWGRCCPMQG